ncbi:transcription factor Adf-1-like [Spodoptera frugiperda]|uniref:Transcription factor Adf-1-like n=1 Tax=Spodoptera frugiperda TaxID=7108 RepID=A0A9R0DQP6_SPOFR|nr:transcription factor Adf-1-like [Spodoptera frugiperda]
MKREYERRRPQLRFSPAPNGFSSVFDRLSRETVVLLDHLKRIFIEIMSSTESESVSYVEYENLSQKIIMEVQKRPALYDTTLRHDRKTKDTLWEEVYQHVFSNWGTLSKAEKIQKGHKVQKRWKNMRDSFANELSMQRRKSGHGVIKKRKYVHFDSMMFLVPSLRKKETSTNTESSSQDNPGIESSETQNINKRHSKDLSETNSNRTSFKKASRSSKMQSDDEADEQPLQSSTLTYKEVSKSQRDIEDVQSMPNVLNTETNTSEYDEDINFSQMIVPMLRKLDDDQKHFAKVGILNILQKAKSL